jgi:hypothetical protein
VWTFPGLSFHFLKIEKEDRLSELEHQLATQDGFPEFVEWLRWLGCRPMDRGEITASEESETLIVFVTENNRKKILTSQPRCVKESRVFLSTMRLADSCLLRYARESAPSVPVLVSLLSSFSFGTTNDRLVIKDH